MIKVEGFVDIMALHRQWLSQQKIADKFGLPCNTVKKYIESNALLT